LNPLSEYALQLFTNPFHVLRKKRRKQDGRIRGYRRSYRRKKVGELGNWMNEGTLLVF
jgi:hypothetical protein